METPADSPDRADILADVYALILSWSEPAASGEEAAVRAAPQEEEET